MSFQMPRPRRKVARVRNYLLFLWLLLLAPIGAVLAGQVQLAWDASTGATGYRSLMVHSLLATPQISM